ncbi:MAG: ATP-dependent DNA helicase [Candidatus Thalassarchaeaceae archaeon]|jgi:DNA excision repair protein ERCC-2|nr:ATP-dependent DNA helicase [Candidatus Thalassarchaeaceae archaeon]
MGTETSLTAAEYLAHETLRDGQKQMIQDGIGVLEKNGFLLSNAPTGIGKTAAALSAALTVAQSRDEPTHIMFLTGRQAQHRIVVDTVRLINENCEQKVRLIDMIGQYGMCIHPILSDETPIGFSRNCANLRSKRQCDYFNEESPTLRLKVLQDPLHVHELVSVCQNHHAEGVPKPTCPWKVARESAIQADVIVCDYNHLFIEKIRDASLKAMGIELKNVIVIVDEAHNLPERILMGLRHRLTAELIRDSVYELQEHSESMHERFAKKNSGASTAEEMKISRARACEAALKRFRNRLLQWIKEQKETMSKSNGRRDELEMRVEPEQILGMLRQEMNAAISGDDIELSGLIDELLRVNVEVEDGEEETASYRLATVLGILKRFARSSAMCLALTIKGDSAWMTTHLLDPALIGKDVFDTIKSGILMSGTLTPPQMFADSLGIPKNRPIVTEEYPSPFMADRRPVMIATDVTTLWDKRGEENTRKIRNQLHALLQHTPGHVAVFCPSYSMLNEIIGEGDWPGRVLITEQSNWTKNMVDGVMDDMRSYRIQGRKVLLAGVFGGRMSEGLDYSGNLLDGVACIGIPNPPRSVQNDALKAYIEEKFDRNIAWRYAVLQPSVNRVLQAMGRAIRKAEDRAFILLLDNRLLKPTYKRCLPPTFTPFTSDNPQRTARQVKRFFQRHPEPAIGEE